MRNYCLMPTRMATARNPESNRQGRHKLLSTAAEWNNLEVPQKHARTHAHLHMTLQVHFWYFCPLDKCPSLAQVLVVLLRAAWDLLEPCQRESHWGWALRLYSSASLPVHTLLPESRG